MEASVMDINKFFELSVKLKASDLHISPGLPPICRVNGELTIANEEPITPAMTQQLLLGLMNPEQEKIFNTKKQLDFVIRSQEFGHFRINVFRQTHGVAAVFRLVPSVIPSLEQLGVPEIFKKLLTLSSGLILVSGPTGSGKSTTLAAMIDFINTHQASHIITIEDPIEFMHKSKKSLISQRQAYYDATNFSEALRASLREDPDVIMVGEMRDLKTIRLALTAAETGHLVLATLHTSSAPRAVNRIIDVFPATEKDMVRNLLAESIQAVLCQMLIKTEAGSRVAAFETMLGTNAIRNCIREDKIPQMYSVIQTGSKHGMCTMEKFIQSLVEKKVITSTSASLSNTNRDIFGENENSGNTNQNATTLNTKI